MYFFFFFFISNPFLAAQSAWMPLPFPPPPPRFPSSLSLPTIPPCFFIKTTHCELLWPPSLMRRQSEGRGHYRKGQEEQNGGRLGGEKPPGPSWLVKFLEKQTSRQRPHSTNHPSIHLRQNLICRGFSRKTGGQRDREIEREQRRQTRAVISYAQDKVLTQSHTAC